MTTPKRRAVFTGLALILAVIARCAGSSNDTVIMEGARCLFVAPSIPGKPDFTGR